MNRKIRFWITEDKLTRKPLQKYQEFFKSGVVTISSCNQQYLDNCFRDLHPNASRTEIQINNHWHGVR